MAEYDAFLNINQMYIICRLDNFFYYYYYYHMKFRNLLPSMLSSHWRSWQPFVFYNINFLHCHHSVLYCSILASCTEITCNSPDSVTFKSKHIRPFISPDRNWICPAWQLWFCNSVAFSMQANYTNSAVTACRRSWCQPFRVQACHMVSTVSPHSH